MFKDSVIFKSLKQAKDSLLGKCLWYISLSKDKIGINFIQQKFKKGKLEFIVRLTIQAVKESAFLLYKGKLKYYRALPDIGIAFYSQNKEELIIRSFFQDRQKGFFVDVGCAWPLLDSNTYLLEKQLSWSGIAVDANPGAIDIWEKHRKNSQLFTYLISNQSDKVEKFYKAGGLGSTQKERRFGNKIIRGKEVMLPTITLNKLLDDNGVEKIDFISIDIEQSEVRALQEFDINRFKPELVCIECTRPVRTEILAYFELNNYEVVESYLKYKSHWYFVPK